MGILERKNREKGRRRQTILSSARESFLEKGLEAASLADIAEKAELSKASIYLYFRDKTSLLEELLGQTLEKLDRLMEEASAGASTGLETLKAMGRAYTRLCLEYPDDFFFVQLLDLLSLPLKEMTSSPTSTGRLMEKMRNRLFTSFERGMADGSLRGDLDIQKSAVVLAQLFSGFMRQLAALRDQVQTNTGYAPEILIEHLFEILINAIGNPQKQEKS